MLDQDALELAWRFLIGLSPIGILSLFWFTIIFEVPRYMLGFVATIIAIPARWGRPSQMPCPLPKVSILVVGHNEESSIGRCVASLCEQTYPSFEIVCVDDGSEDRTFAIMHKLEREGQVQRAVRCELRGGKPSACNLAARLATGEILVVVFGRKTMLTSLRKKIRPDNLKSDVRAGGRGLARRLYLASVVILLSFVFYYTVGGLFFLEAQGLVLSDRNCRCLPLQCARGYGSSPAGRTGRERNLVVDDAVT